MKADKTVWLVLLLLGGIFTTVGVVVGLFVARPMLNNARATEQWPQTDGEVLESSLQESQGDDGILYSAHVVYRYALDGGEFESSRIWYGGQYSTGDRSEIFEVVKRFPVGSSVTVYYSPDKPSESVLIPGTFVVSQVLSIIGFIFLAVGGFLLLLMVRFMVRPRSGKGSLRDPADHSNPTFGGGR